MKSPLLCVIVVIVCSTTALGGVVNVDLTNNASHAPTSNNLPGVLGDQTSAVWNPYGASDAQVVMENLLDEDGNSTGVSFISNASASIQFGPNAGNGSFGAGGSENDFFRNYQFLSSGGNPGTPGNSSVAFGDLIPGLAYDVVLYATWEFADAGSTFTYDGTSKTATGVPSESNAAFVEGQSFVRFNSAVADPNGNILIEWESYLPPGGRHRGPLNGLQIEGMFGATNPNPANGAISVDPDDLNSNGLSWDQVDTPSVTGSYFYLGLPEADPNFFGVSPIYVPGNGSNRNIVPAGSPFGLDQTVYWRVDTETNNGGDCNAIMGPVWTFDTLKSVPLVTADPQRAAHFPGETAVFVCDFTSISAVSDSEVEWLKDGALVGNGSLAANGGGSYTATLTLPNVSAASRGDYSCRIKGTTTSAGAELLIKRQLAHWEFEGDYTDSLGNLNLLPLDPNEGMPVFVSGLVGSSAVDCNGIEDILVFDFTEEQEYFAGYTVSLWTKTSDAGQNEWSGIFSTESTGSDGFQLDLDGSGNFRYRDGSNSTLAPVEVDTWTYLTVVSDGVSTTAYLNGLQAAADPDVQPFVEGITFGANRSRTILYEGSIDDAMFWNYPRSQDQITQDYFDVTGLIVCDPAIQNPLDFTGPADVPDCQVNLLDYVLMHNAWMDCRLLPASQCLQ